MNLSPESLSQKPIVAPGSPFWNVFKRFGRDEAIAMVINVMGTAIAGMFSVSVLFLSIIGPIIEKIGFFPAHLTEAWKIYKTTPKDQRESLFFYLKKALKSGSISLAEDVFVHDPVYIALMFIGLNIYQGTPPWLLSVVSFIVAVIAVAFIEVGITEGRYLLFKWRAKRAGFGFESYFESRFLINSSADPDVSMELLSSRFELNTMYEMTYGDVYYDNKFPEYSDRTAKFRMRRRTNEHNDLICSAQIVYTRAAEICENKFDQCRFFPIKKDKIYFAVTDPNTTIPNEIKKSAREFLCKHNIDLENKHVVKFTRVVAYNKNLLISADRVRGSRNFYLIEVKVYKDIRLLMQAMRFIMKELPVLQTTRGKLELTT
jgi:hypothetical protein